MARRPRKIPAGAIPITLGVLATITVLWWTPWNHVHPFYPSLVLGTVHAPLWRKPVAPGARYEIDASALALRLVAIWVAVGVWLGVTIERWS